MIAEIATIVAPVFIVAALGFIWARSGSKFDNGMITSLVMMLGTPCLVLDTFLTARPSPDAFAETFAAGLTLFAGFAVVGMVVLKICGWSFRDFLPALMFPNMGNMGLPLSLFAFGNEGLALAIVLFAMAAIGNFTIGTAIASGTMNPRAILRMPIIYAVALSLIVTTTGFTPPRWFANTVHLLGGLTIPLMLVALGVSLSRLRAKSLPRSLFLSLVRLVGGFGVALLVIWAFDLQGAARGAVLMQASMPTAVFNYLFAERYGRNAPEVAGMVLISTLLSFVTLPLLLWYVL